MAYVLWLSVAGFEGSFFLFLRRQVSGVWAGVAVSRNAVLGRRGCMLPVLLRVNYSVEKGLPAVKKC